MSLYTNFFLNSKAYVVQLECLEISHSLFSQIYYLVRNATQGVTVTHENGLTKDYQYYPMQLQLSGPRDDLDHVLKVALGDVGSIVAQELEAVRASDGFNELPKVIYRTYRSDTLIFPLYGPLHLEVRKVNLNAQGAQFEARAPSLNNNRTGELYSLGRFPMLRGLL